MWSWKATPNSNEPSDFSLYHLISSADPESDLASVGARGLSGRGYKGHVFWDTDVFILPFFMYTHPATARALLAYRYRTLDAARARAASLGYRGALFAWESADTGEDVTPTEAVGPDGRPVGSSPASRSTMCRRCRVGCVALLGGDRRRRIPLAHGG